MFISSISRLTHHRLPLPLPLLPPLSYATCPILAGYPTPTPASLLVLVFCGLIPCPPNP